MKYELGILWPDAVHLPEWTFDRKHI